MLATSAPAAPAHPSRRPRVAAERAQQRQALHHQLGALQSIALRRGRRYKQATKAALHPLVARQRGDQARGASLGCALRMFAARCPASASRGRQVASRRQERASYQQRSLSTSAPRPSEQPAICLPRALPQQQPGAISSSAVVAALALAAPADLATYNWPPRQQQLQQQQAAALPWGSASGRAWFEAAVQAAVRQLDGRPFLLRVSQRPLLRVSVVRLEPGELAAGWQHVQARHLAASGGAAGSDDALVLVHPVAAQEQPCVVSHVTGGACPGCPHTAPAASAAYGEATELLAGKLGDCCSSGGDHEHSHGHGHGHTQQGQPQQQPQQGQPQQQPQQAAAAGGDSSLAYHGLVVQCRDGGDPLQGCYLLKTVQAGGAGCHCTHYSLNRVCQGPPLQQQFQAAWLA